MQQAEVVLPELSENLLLEETDYLTKPVVYIWSPDRSLPMDSE